MRATHGLLLTVLITAVAIVALPTASTAGTPAAPAPATCDDDPDGSYVERTCALLEDVLGGG